MIKTKTSKMMMLATVAVVTVLLGGFTIINTNAQEEALPIWIQNVAGFWSNGDVSDTEFVNAMEFLVDQGIMNLPNTVSAAEAQTITSSLEEMSDRLEKVEAQTPTAIGTTIAAPITSNQPSIQGVSYSSICPSNMVQHWDNVSFKFSDDIDYIRTSDKNVEDSVINQGDVMSMKFRTSASQVDTIVNLKGKVWDRLKNDLGFVQGGPSGTLDSSDIEILDAEYAIVCAYPPGAVEYAIPAPMK